MDILLGLSPTYQECPSERVNPKTLLVLIDVVVGIGALVLGFASAVATMNPPVPHTAEHNEYVKVRMSKAAAAAFSGWLVLICLFALFAVWSALGSIPTGDFLVDSLTLVSAVLFTVLSVVGLAGVLVRHRGLARQLRL
jgi:hypothetical protein